MASSGDLYYVNLLENKVSGAIFSHSDVSQNSVISLKRWLGCCGFPTEGTKQNFHSLYRHFHMNLNTYYVLFVSIFSWAVSRTLFFRKGRIFKCTSLVCNTSLMSNPLSSITNSPGFNLLRNPHFLWFLYHKCCLRTCRNNKWFLLWVQFLHCSMILVTRIHMTLLSKSSGLLCKNFETIDYNSNMFEGSEGSW